MKPPVMNFDLPTLLDYHAGMAASFFHCHKLGTIEKFDPSAQTAEVRIAHKCEWQGKVRDYPLLVDVPVFVPAGGGAALTMPVKPGDPCLVLFSDRDIDAWFAKGAKDAVPPTARMHDIADGLAIVGFRPATAPVPSYHADDAELRNAGGGVVLAAGADGKISLRNSGDTLHALLSNFVDDLTSLLSGWKDNPDGSPKETPTAAAITSLKSTYKSRIAALLK
ncbi:MAG: hypothetical protein LBC18_06200 [Opitutaceae bacterium]|jgi:hypothetical protein|nr:hypothetical protein [Opitutaceae bacterium]